MLIGPIDEMGVGIWAIVAGVFEITAAFLRGESAQGRLEPTGLARGDHRARPIAASS